MPPLAEICNVADELKVIIQDKNDFEWAEKYRKLWLIATADYFFNLNGADLKKLFLKLLNISRKIQYWRISLQVHKYMHIP